MCNSSFLGFLIVFQFSVTLCVTAQPSLIVLGIAQDGGVPQAGTKAPDVWRTERKRHASCLAIVDPATSQRWLIDATPDFPEQLHMLDRLFPVRERPGLAGIFLTHAHVGHYTGLMFLGHEVMGAKGVPVFAMPRMHSFLFTNGPWSQLVRYGNIHLRPMRAGVKVMLTSSLSITPFLVPHRQEFSEVVGFRIDGPKSSALYIPDIDSWEQFDSMGTRIEDLIAAVDVAYIDGTFFENGEIPGRDMSGFPHPFITHSMKRFASLPESEKRKVRFIHLNHTNPALWQSAERKAVETAGFRVAEEGERFGF